MQNMMKGSGKMTTGTPKQSYRDLLLTFLPRPIKSEQAYGLVQAEIDRLIDQDELSPAEQEYLDLLGTLVWEYEARVEDRTEFELRGVELVKGLLALHNLKQKDLLPIFKTKSIVSAVLNGKRQLTVAQINGLAAFFNLPHALFFEPILLTNLPARSQTHPSHPVAHN